LARTEKAPVALRTKALRRKGPAPGPADDGTIAAPVVPQAAIAANAAVRTARPDTHFERPTRRSRKTRLALVDAARQLLEEQGLSALTVKAVTDLADVGHGTFYHHFPSTEAVLAAGIEQSMREFSEALERGFADAEDKSWVFVASLASTFRMLAAHPALPWMLERPQVLAAALRDACGPFARRDITAMLVAGDIGDNAPARAAWMEWLMVGAVVDASRPGIDAPARLGIEARLIEMVLRVLGLGDARIAALVKRLATADLPAAAIDGAKRSATESPRQAQATR
jgi:AcrR family transcriptional regulator